MKRICWLIVALMLNGCTPAPPFIDATGKEVSLHQFVGKPLLINYFAPWCAPCLREMPLLHALAQEGKMTVLAVHYDPATPAELRQVARQYRLTLPLLVARQDAELPFPHPAGLPTSYLLDAEGKLQQTLVGELDAQKVAALKAAIKQQNRSD